MPQAKFTQARISGISTCTGPLSRTLEQDAQALALEPIQLERLRNLVGIHSRHVAPPGVTTLDLCESAARCLLAGAGVAADSLDAVVCVTQTPDHWQPCNANLLHGRLGLTKSAAAFDINQGCSGWVYGLYLAYGMVQAGGCRRVLLLAGDTVTQTINPRDRAVVPLFGDAGTATLIERTGSEDSSWFSLHSDGKGHSAICIPAGGHRLPSSAATAVEATDADGNVRAPDDLFMNGIEVFNFTLREEPLAVRELLEFSGHAVESIDAFVFHQANRFILSNLAKRIKAPLEKVPWRTAERFGNQSSASVPAAICDALGSQVSGRSLKVLCSGFGVGLSWASCVLSLGPLTHCSLHQYDQSSNAFPP
ncbi:MAG: ketoacyl-ACP synthase III [Candidatus Didemnitutus sp.]|nr:ketoacyl-ACP synthase III [Candidatus Didemnitutus sp.]